MRQIPTTGEGPEVRDRAHAEGPRLELLLYKETLKGSGDVKNALESHYWSE